MDDELILSEFITRLFIPKDEQFRMTGCVFDRTVVTTDAHQSLQESVW